MKCIDYPYKYFLEENFFSEEQFNLLKKFSEETQWEFFYDKDFPQYISTKKSVQEYFISNANTRSTFNFLFELQFINELNKLFGIKLTCCVSICFHKLIKGCFNSIHNDSNNFGEKIRIIVYLSDPSDYEGGELNLYQNSNQIIPVSSNKFNANTAFLFSMNDISLHSVSEITKGERLCVVITYY